MEAQVMKSYEKRFLEEELKHRLKIESKMRYTCDFVLVTFLPFILQVRFTNAVTDRCHGVKSPESNYQAGKFIKPFTEKCKYIKNCEGFCFAFIYTPIAQKGKNAGINQVGFYEQHIFATFKWICLVFKP
jgi:hypothetical protein